jgi:hypothetical protein
VISFERRRRKRWKQKKNNSGMKREWRKEEEEEELENESTTDLNSARSRFPNRDLSLSLFFPRHSLSLFILIFFFALPFSFVPTGNAVYISGRRPMREIEKKGNKSVVVVVVVVTTNAVLSFPVVEKVLFPLLLRVY